MQIDARLELAGKRGDALRDKLDRIERAADARYRELEQAHERGELTLYELMDACNALAAKEASARARVGHEALDLALG